MTILKFLVSKMLLADSTDKSGKLYLISSEGINIIQTDDIKIKGYGRARNEKSFKD